MSEQFDAGLSGLGRELREMASLVAQAMDRARTAFESADVHLAEEVISGDLRIDHLEERLDARCIELLDEGAPGREALTTVVAALRMSSSLERMGDLARHIAQLTRLRYPELVVPEERREAFSAMTGLAVEVGTTTAALIETLDPDLMDRISELNGRMNALHAENFRAIGDPSWTASAPTTTDLTLASRYLERFTDHALSVAHKVGGLVPAAR